jgi:CheY-like chemotaxis protein
MRFEVEDTGIGIAAEDLKRLFQDFEQGDTGTTRQYGGTGLGLAITRRLAHLMGGDAGAESSQGVGSTFWFTARLKRGSAVEPSAHGIGADETPTVAPAKTDANALMEVLQQRHDRPRILLAEDNEANRQLALAMLQRVGLSADLAMDGTEAVQRAQEVDYDLILMDMQMPKMDGVQATQAIRTLPRHANTPILAMTANAFDEERTQCLAAGMNDFITKPVRMNALFASLAQWLAPRI